MGADKVTPGQSIKRGNLDISNRIAGGTEFGVEIDPNDLRDNNSGADGWMEGVNSTPKPPRTDPETYDYKVNRNSGGNPKTNED